MNIASRNSVKPLNTEKNQRRNGDDDKQTFISIKLIAHTRVHKCVCVCEMNALQEVIRNATELI